MNSSFKSSLNKLVSTLLVSLFFLLSCHFAFGQASINISQGGTVNVTNGDKFYDAGGPGAAQNDGATGYTITLCPTVAGEKVGLDFTYFDTYFQENFGWEFDTLAIYDGLSTSGLNIGLLKGNYSKPYNTSDDPWSLGALAPSGAYANIYTPTKFTATNATGCLTLRYGRLNGFSQNRVGWDATVYTIPQMNPPGCSISLVSDDSSVCDGTSVLLTATGSLVSLPVNSDFNDGTFGAGWTTTAGVANIVANACSSPSIDGSKYLWMSNYGGARDLATNAMDVSSGGYISFEYRQATGNGDGSPCEAPDRAGALLEGVYLQYSINGGTSWTTIKYIYPNATEGSFGSELGLTGCGNYVKRWTKMIYPIPAAAKTASTKFRWVQPANSGASYDNWGLDNVLITSTKPYTITIADKATPAVILASSSTSPMTYSPNPTVTTTYLATISDGISSCTSEVTINVTNCACPTASIDYGSSTFCSTIATSQSANLTGTGTYTGGSYSALPAGLTIDATTGEINPSTSAPGVYTVTYSIAPAGGCVLTVTATDAITIVGQPSVATASTTIQPTCLTSTGTIEVTAPIGAYEYNIDGGAYQASTTFAGVSAGGHNILVRSTVDNTCISNSTAVTVNAVPTPPSVPTAASTTQPTCAVPTGTIVFTTQAGVEYSVGGAYQASETFAGLVPNTYTLTVRSTTDNTCIATAASTVTINAVPTPPSVPTVASTTQPTCAVPTGTIVFTTQAGVEYSVGGAYQASETFAGLVPNTYTLTVRSITDNTCTTNAASTVTINAAPNAPTIPTVASTIQPTCAIPTGTIVFTTQAGVEYSVGGAYQASETFAGLGPNTYTLTVRSTTDNTCITPAASTVTINAAPTPPTVPTVASTIQPTCAVPSGTIVFTTQAGVEYSVGGAYQVSETFAGLVPNTYTLTVRSLTDNTCTTNAASTITINAVPTPPSTPTVASTTQPTCAVPTGTIVFTTQAGVEYSVGGAHQASETFAGLAPNTYTLTVRSVTDNTCTTNAASTITINAAPNAPTVPTVASTTQPTCAVPTGAIVFTTQAGVEYSIGGAYQVSETFAGLVPNTYTLTVRSTIDNTCITPAASTVTINAAPTPPTVPTVASTTQPTCAVPTGTIVFTTQAGVQYSVGGAFQASETFSGLAPNTYTLTVRNATDTTCTTNAASMVTINAVPTPPSVSTVASTTQPTCAVPTGTIVFTTQAGVEYSVGGAYQASETFAGLAPNTYTLTVRSVTDNTCTTNAASTITINAAPNAPTVPTVASTTQPTCAVPTGTIVFTTQAGVEYSIGGAYQASETFAGLVPNTYTLTVRSTIDNSCATNAASTVTINAVPTPPSVPTVASTTQPTCAVPTGTIVFTTQAGVEYSVGGAYQASETFAGLVPNTYTLTVRNSADNTCSTPAASTVTINAVPTPPSIPTVASTTQPTCAVPTGTIVFTTQAGVEYSVGGAYQASETFAGLAPNTYTLTVRSLTDNTCATNAASTVTINAVPTPPSIPTVASTTQPTCAVPTGTIVFTTQAGVEYSVGGAYQASETFAGLLPNTYSLTVRSITDNTCITPTASIITINAVPTPPTVPTVASTTQPTCAVPTGTIVFTTQAGVEYSVGGAYQASETFAGLVPNTYTLTVRNSADHTCSTAAASTVTINAVPTPPSIPTVVSATQPTCAVPTGTIVFTTQAGVEYSVGGAYQASETFAGLAPNTYTLTVRSLTDNTCATNAASTVTINTVPTPPSIPTVASTTQPTCAVPTGTIVFTTQAGVEYSVGGAYQASETFAGLLPNTYSLTVRSTTDNTCITPTASTITINAVPTPPTVPTVASTTQPTCAVPTGTIVFTTQAGVEYSVGGAYQASETFAGLVPNTYTLTVRNSADHTCSTPAASTVTINAVPTPPSIPTVASTTQPTCAVPTGTIVFATQAGVEYSVGGAFQASETFAGLAANTYTLSVRSIADNTCSTNAASTVAINASIPPSVPTVASTIQPTCAIPTGTIVFTTQAGVEYSVGGAFQASATFSGLSPNTYTLTVRSIVDNTCLTNAVSSVTINAAPTPPTVPTIASTTQPTCGVPTGTIVFTTQTGVEYSVGGAFQASTTFSGLSQNTYTLTVRNLADNTCSTNASSTVTINAVPTPPVIPTVASTTQPTCAVPTGIIVFAAQAGVEYSVGGAYQASQTFAGLSSNTYTLTVRSVADNTCSTNAAATVTINAVPSPPTVPTVASTTHPTCATPTGTIVFATQAGVEYSIGGAFQASPIFSGLSPNTYILTVRSLADNTCSTNASSSVTINPITTPSATITYSSTSVCSSVSSFTPTLTGTTGGIFSSTGGLTINATTGVVTPGTSAAGNYVVTYTIPVSPGCAEFNAYANITITTLPTASISFAGGSYCTSVSTDQPISLTGTSGGLFSALPSGLTINPTTGAVTPSTSTPGAYTIAYTIAAAGGCAQVQAQAPVTIVGLPTITISGSSTICNGKSTTLTASGATTYTWSNGATGPSITVSPTMPSNTFTVTGTLSGCQNTASVTVTVNNPPTVIITGTDTICNGGTTTLTASGASTYLWAHNNATTNNVTVFPSTTTTYSVTGTSNGCPSISSFIVYVISKPVISFTTTNPGCTTNNGMIQSTVSGGSGHYFYNWSNGSSSTAIYNLAPGSYNLIVNDGYCNSTGTATLLNPNLNLKAAMLIRPKVTTILDGDVMFSDVSDGDIAEWDWTFGDGKSSSGSWVAQHHYSAIGTYPVRLIVHNAAGCSDTIQDTVVIQDIFTLYVPSAFTPDNNLINDGFHAYGNGIDPKTFNMVIYDRWGGLIFTADEWIDGKSFPAWDGSKNNDGVILPIGVYVYQVTVSDLTGKQHRKVGSISIIK